MLLAVSYLIGSWLVMSLIAMATLGLVHRVPSASVRDGWRAACAG